MDKDFKKIARPDHIINEQNNYLLFYLQMKISPYFTYFFFKYTKITPNIISITSIIFLSFSIISIFMEDYIYVFFFLFMNLLLDNIDGELARTKKLTSNFGEFLEKLNTDLFNIFFYNSIALTLHLKGFLNIEYLFFFIFNSIFYTIFRSKISQVSLSKDYEINNFRATFIGLYKYSRPIRNQFRHARLIYNFFWNVISSGGVSEIIVGILLISGSIKLTVVYLVFLNITFATYFTLLTTLKYFLYKKYRAQKN